MCCMHETARAMRGNKMTSECGSQVRDRLIQLARDGNVDVERYGDQITDAAACSRFARGAKGNVAKAVDMFKTHLEWRMSYNLESIVDEDFTDLKAYDELYWGGRDKDGVMTLMWRYASTFAIYAEREILKTVHILLMPLICSAHQPYAVHRPAADIAYNSYLCFYAYCSAGVI